MGKKLRLAKPILISLIVVLSFSQCIIAQQDSVNTKRLKTVIVTETVAYAGTMAGLYGLWYKNEPSSSFHTFNDNDEWFQMDKVGHSVTSYYVGMAGYEALRWSGVSRKK